MDCAQCALSCGSAGEWWLSCEECSCVRRTFGGCGVRRSRSPSQIISSLKESPRLALIQHDLHDRVPPPQAQPDHLEPQGVKRPSGVLSGVPCVTLCLSQNLTHLSESHVLDFERTSAAADYAALQLDATKPTRPTEVSNPRIRRRSLTQRLVDPS